LVIASLLLELAGDGCEAALGRALASELVHLLHGSSAAASTSAANTLSAVCAASASTRPASLSGHTTFRHDFILIIVK